MASIFDLRITENKLMDDGSESGPDLEYAPSFIALMADSARQQERQVGGSVLPAREPDWNDVFSQGCALLASARDLRALVITAQAATHKYGLRGCDQSLQLVADWLEQFWDSVHPRLEIDGEFDPLLRANAVAALADVNGLLRQLRRSPLLATPVGVITVADVERLHKGRDLDEGAAVRSIQELREAIEREAAASQTALQHILEASRNVAAIERHFLERLDAEYRPNLSQLSSLLDGLISATGAQAERAAAAESVAVPQQDIAAPQQGNVYAPQVAAASTITVKTVEGLPKELGSMSDAFLALSLVRQYFEKYEPSHPAPILIRRIERLKGKDFLAIVRELAPDGLNQLQMIAGPEDAGASP